MIHISKSDLADLARYPASLQQAALALWGEGLASRALSAAQSPSGAHHKTINHSVSGIQK